MDLKIDLDVLRDLEKQKLITLRKHPEQKLYIANYTPRVQYEKLWTPVLEQCRGLIVSHKGDIVKRPFKKFFNVEELESFPDEQFEISEKLDGSLGILYNDDCIATRGSFESPQALEGTRILREQYYEYINRFNENKTYLFEIIYPENRIVVDYGKLERLVLLAIIDTETGKEFSLDSFDFPDKARTYPFTEIKQIRNVFENDSDEGVVVRFESGFRMKIKFEEYKRLHKLLTGISTKTVWEYLKNKRNFNEIMDRVPDEFTQWVLETKAKIDSHYAQTKNRAKESFQQAPKGSRKDFAQWAVNQQNSHLLFKLLDGKDIQQDVWKIVKPETEGAFKCDS